MVLDTQIDGNVKPMLYI